MIKNLNKANAGLPLEHPDALEARRSRETFERELIFGYVASYAFYKSMRDIVCPWDPKMGRHRQDFSVGRYNKLYRAIDAFYRRFDNKQVADGLFVPPVLLNAMLIDWGNKNIILLSTAQELVAEVNEEIPYTQTLTLESLTALSHGAAFKDWLNSRMVDQLFGTFTSLKGLGRLTIEAMVDGVRECNKSILLMETDVVSLPSVPESNLAPGPFPIEALTPVMREIAEQTADVYQIPASVTALTALATLSGAMGKTWAVTDAVNGHVTPVNLYIVIGAPKSFGKGSASRIAKPLIDASEQMTREFQNNNVPKLKAELHEVERKIRDLEKNESGAKQASESLPDLIKKQEKIEAALKSSPTLWVGSATGPALSNVLAANKETIFSYSAEAGDMVRIAMGRFNREKNGDFDLFLSAYSGEWTGESRVGRGTVRICPSIAALWFCQPMVFQEVLGNNEAKERGLISRIIGHVVKQDMVPEDDGCLRNIEKATYDAWAGLVSQVLQVRREEKPQSLIRCSTEAREVFRVFHNECVQLRNGPLQDITDDLGRARENAIRVAAVLYTADVLTGSCNPNGELSKDQAARAVQIVRWTQLSMLQYLSEDRAKKQLEEVHNLISRLSRMGTEITVRDVERRAGVSQEKLLTLTAAFPDLIRVVRKKPPGGGRPSEVLQILS